MRFSLVLATLLCITTWMSLVRATQGRAPVCCLRWSTTRVPVEAIMNYTIQCEGTCLIKAIVFQTQSRKRICSDPNSNWAKKAREKVDRETKALQMEQNEQGPAKDITPPMSTASKEVIVKMDEEATTLLQMKQREQGSARDTTPPMSTASKKETVKVDEEATTLQVKQRSARETTPPMPTASKKVIVKVDEEPKALQMKQKEERSTRDITPAVSTASRKKAPWRKGRKRRRLQRKRSWRRRIGQRKRA